MLYVRSFLCPMSIFGISKIPTHCLKEALITRPLSWMVDHLSDFVDYLADKTKPVWDLMQKDSQWVSRTPKQKA